MTATNHAVTGAIIVAAVTNPIIGLPLALMSHFALDSLPHFGAHTKAKAGSREFTGILTFDGVLLIAILVAVSFASHSVGIDWWLLPLGALLAVVPDIMWLKHYQNDLRGEEKHWDKMRYYHKKIQQWELSSGWIIEIIWFVAAVLLLNRLLFS